MNKTNLPTFRDIFMCWKQESSCYCWRFKYEKNRYV